MKAFLIVKTSAIGDVIQTFPVLEYLRARFPEARIDWVVEKSCFELVKAHPALSNAFVIDTKSWRKAPFSQQTRKEFIQFSKLIVPCLYDTVFDLQGNAKSGLITSVVRAMEKVGFNWTSAPEKLNVLATTLRFAASPQSDVRTRYLTLVQQYFQDPEPFQTQGVVLRITNAEAQQNQQVLGHPALDGPVWMVAFGSRWPNKQLSLTTLKEFLLRLQSEYGLRFALIWGNAEERTVAESLMASLDGKALAIGGMSLPQWQALMAQMDGVIAADSAGLHLAGAANVPTFSYFGPSAASMYCPSGEKHVAVQGTCPYGLQFIKRCPQLRTCATGACLKDLNAEVLFSAFQKVARNRYSAPQAQSPR